MRSRYTLGKTARRGERTGVAEIAQIDTAAKRLVSKMPTCGRGARRPDSSATLEIRRLDTGKRERLQVDIYPEKDSAGEHGYYSARLNYIRLYFPDRCTQEKELIEKIKPLLEHEATHASDPGLRARAGGQLDIPDAEKDFCAYTTHPLEARAYFRNIYTELNQPEMIDHLRSIQRLARRREAGYRLPAEYVLDRSNTWREVGRCYWPKKKLRRKALQLVAHIWEKIK